VSHASRWSRRSIAVAACLILATAGAAVAVAETTSTQYAMTPTSAGAIDLTAVPLGDGYVSTTPKVGYVDSCITSFSSTGGAAVDGPWIDTTNKTWNETTKIAVNGAVAWPAASYKVTLSGTKRTIVFNDLPNHTTGVFPIASSDPAHAYDGNPNHIAAQSVNWTLAATPKAAAKPSCTSGGPIGVLSDGAYLYNALDGEGRDAAAHEVLDSCAGHPDQSDSYHHHDIPSCILDKTPNGKATLVGYALDGYGIYVVKDASGNLPTNTSLDACHGTTSVVPWNGKPTKIYHYVATYEYPYTVGCYHGTPISNGHGGGGGGGGSGGGGAGARSGPPAGGPPAPVTSTVTVTTTTTAG
jgi:hypothetical protein